MSGGAGVLITDRLVERGLRIAELTSSDRQRIAEALPGLPAIGVPLDFGPVYSDPQAIITAVRCLAMTDSVDLVLAFMGLSPNLAGVVEEPLAAIAEESGKPLVLAWLGGPAAGRRRAQSLGVPALPDPIRAADAVAALVHASDPLPVDRPIPAPRADLAARLDGLIDAGIRQLTERETKQLLADAGIPVAADRLARSRDEAMAAAAAIGMPVAVKAEAPSLTHKSDVGAVRLSVQPADAADAFDAVVAAARNATTEVNGAVIAPMAPTGGVELLIGGRWDDQFGPVVLVGRGGLTSEVERDVVVDLAPVDHARALEMVGRLRIAPVLQGFRGADPFAMPALADALVRLGELISSAGGRLAEIDVNPLTVYEPALGVLALDAAAILGESHD
jgi:acyl-CoA synthetase (NDP forming)